MPKVRSKSNRTPQAPASTVDIPDISDLQNKPFDNFLEKIVQHGFKSKPNQTQSGSHIRQYERRIETNDKDKDKDDVLYLNLQPNKEGKAKTYQIRKFINILKHIDHLKNDEKEEATFDDIINDLTEELQDTGFKSSDLLDSLDTTIKLIQNNSNKQDNYSKFIEALTQKIEQSILANPLIYDQVQQKRLLQNYVYLLQKCDHINQSNKQKTSFQIPAAILEPIKPIPNVKSEFGQLKAKIGKELADTGNYVLPTLDGKELYLLTTNSEGNVSKLYTINLSEYTKLLDLEMNYNVGNDQTKLTTLRNILQGETGAVSKLRLRVPENSVKTATFEGFQIHYATLPEKHTEPGGKNYSEIFIYDDQSLPIDLLEEKFGSNIAIDRPIYATIRIASTEKDQNSVDIIQVPSEYVLLKKSSVTTGEDNSKLEHGFIITGYTVDANDKEVEKYTFIQESIVIVEQIPNKFKGCDLNDLQRGFIVIPTNQIQLIEKFKQDVENFSFNIFNFDDEIINLITKSNLSSISMKDLCVEVSSNPNNNNSTKFLCDIIVKLLDKNKKTLFDVNDILQLQLKYDSELMEFSDDRVKKKFGLYFLNINDSIIWRMVDLLILEKGFYQKFNDKAEFLGKLFAEEVDFDQALILDFHKMFEAGCLFKSMEVSFKKTDRFNNYFIANFKNLIKFCLNVDLGTDSSIIIEALKNIMKKGGFIEAFKSHQCEDEFKLEIIFDVYYFLIKDQPSVGEFVAFLNKVLKGETSTAADIALIIEKIYLAYFTTDKSDIDYIINQLKILYDKNEVSERMYNQLFESFTILLTSKVYKLNLENLIAMFSDKKYIPIEYPSEKEFYAVPGNSEIATGLIELTNLIKRKDATLNEIKLVADKLPSFRKEYISDEHYLFAIYVKSVLQQLLYSHVDKKIGKELDAIFDGNYDEEVKATVACLYLLFYSKNHDKKENLKLSLDNLLIKVYNLYAELLKKEDIHQPALILGLSLSLKSKPLGIGEQYTPEIRNLITITYALYASAVDKVIITNIVGWFIESIDANNSAQKNEYQELFIYLTIKWVEKASSVSKKLIHNAFKNKKISMDDTLIRARECLTLNNIRYELLASGVISVGFSRF